MMRGEGGEGGWGERSGGRRVSTGRGRGNSSGYDGALLPRLENRVEIPKSELLFHWIV